MALLLCLFLDLSQTASQGLPPWEWKTAGKRGFGCCEYGSGIQLTYGSFSVVKTKLSANPLFGVVNDPTQRTPNTTPDRKGGCYMVKQRVGGIGAFNLFARGNSSQFQARGQKQAQEKRKSGGMKRTAGSTMDHPSYVGFNQFFIYLSAGTVTSGNGQLALTKGDIEIDLVEAMAGKTHELGTDLKINPKVSGTTKVCCQKHPQFGKGYVGMIFISERDSGNATECCTMGSHLRIQLDTSRIPEMERCITQPTGELENSPAGIIGKGWWIDEAAGNIIMELGTSDMIKKSPEKGHGKAICLEEVAENTLQWVTGKESGLATIYVLGGCLEWTDK